MNSGKCILCKFFPTVCLTGYDMNGRFQMQVGKNWILPKEMNANRFYWDSHWLEIWSYHFCPSMGPNGGSVAMDSGPSWTFRLLRIQSLWYFCEGYKVDYCWILKLLKGQNISF